MLLGIAYKIMGTLVHLAGLTLGLPLWAAVLIAALVLYGYKQYGKALSEMENDAWHLYNMASQRMEKDYAEFKAYVEKKYGWKL